MKILFSVVLTIVAISLLQAQEGQITLSVYMSLFDEL